LLPLISFLSPWPKSVIPLTWKRRAKVRTVPLTTLPSRRPQPFPPPPPPPPQPPVLLLLPPSNASRPVPGPSPPNLPCSGTIQARRPSHSLCSSSSPTSRSSTNHSSNNISLASSPPRLHSSNSSGSSNNSSRGSSALLPPIPGGPLQGKTRPQCSRRGCLPPESTRSPV